MNERNKKYYADILVEYLKLKSAWLKEKTKLEEDYVTQEDLNDMYTFEDPEDIVDQISDPEAEQALTGDSCPHCLVYGPFCDDCPYGKRHGMCDAENRRDDTWWRFITKLGDIQTHVPIHEFITEAGEIVNQRRRNSRDNEGNDGRKNGK